MMHKALRIGLTASAALVLAGAAQAHVVLSQAEAPSGGYYTAFFRVGHGCAGAATVALRIELPEEVLVARPQPKPGWTLRIERRPLPAPVRGEGGRLLTDRVSAITWSGGPLPDEEWDEFGISAKLPSRQGPLYFPAIQTCVTGEERWTEIAPPGQAPRPLRHPAPMVQLGPPAADSPMAGMKMDR